MQAKRARAERRELVSFTEDFWRAQAKAGRDYKVVFLAVPTIGTFNIHYPPKPLSPA